MYYYMGGPLFLITCMEDTRESDRSEGVFDLEPFDVVVFGRSTVAEIVFTRMKLLDPIEHRNDSRFILVYPRATGYYHLNVKCAATVRDTVINNPDSFRCQGRLVVRRCHVWDVTG